MKSELKALTQQYEHDVDQLRARCLHIPEWLKMTRDHSVVGRGAGEASFHIICRNCGCKKIIFRQGDERKKEVKKTLDHQKGFSDQRDGFVQHDYEID